jgi:SAM-dependent methyltransferase
VTREFRERNRLSWNAATRAHNSHKAHQAAFLRDGGSTLRAEELELLGDVADKRLIHLLCNSGQDSLSLAAMGASVTGVDISDEAIDFAVRLSKESGIEASFVRADVYDWLEQARSLGDRYDLAFASYGALPWLPDLTTWAAGVFEILEPGGRLALIEFHPAAFVFDEQWQPRYPHGTGPTPLEWKEGVGDYVGQSGASLAPSGFEAGSERFENPHPCFEFSWSTSQVVQALVDAGFVLKRFVEYPYANGFRQGEGMRELEGGRFAPPAGFPSIPLMFGVAAVRDGSR